MLVHEVYSKQGFDRLDIIVSRALGFGRVGNAFTQVIKAYQQPLRVQRLGHDDAINELFTRHIALSQPPQEVVGKYAVVWRKIDGRWKLATDIWNANK